MLSFKILLQIFKRSTDLNLLKVFFLLWIKYYRLKYNIIKTKHFSLLNPHIVIELIIDYRVPMTYNTCHDLCDVINFVFQNCNLFKKNKAIAL